MKVNFQIKTVEQYDLSEFDEDLQKKEFKIEEVEKQSIYIKG